MGNIAAEEVVKSERFNLTQADIASGDYQDQSQQGDWVYRYQVPVNQELILKPEHKFGAYLQRLDENIIGGLNDDGGTATNYTGDWNNDSAQEMLVTGAGEAVGDNIYIGSHHPFTAMSINITTCGVAATADDIAWQYYNSAAGWVVLPGISDLTVALVAGGVTGEYIVSWRYPSDWRAVINPSDIKLWAWWVRGTVVNADWTTTPQCDRIYIGGAQEMDNPDMVEIQVRNPGQTKMEKVLTCMYEQCKEITEVNKMMTLNLEDEYRVKGGHWIYIVPQCMGGLIDVSTCYFNLETERQRATMYARV